MIEVLSIGEKRLILAYLRQMETMTKHGYYTAVPSTDMVQLQNIYKRHIDSSHIVRPWCSHCCGKVLKGLLPLAKEIIKNDNLIQ